MSDQEQPKALVEADITLNVGVAVSAEDVVLGLDKNDESILRFICETIALSHSVELRERLQERLADWNDEEYL